MSTLTSDTQHQCEPTADDVRAQLERILATSDFGASPQLGRFLRFVVEEALDGRAGALKAYTIGVGVFNRPETFDPQADSIVRVEGSRLRRKLDQYYLGAGRQDPVRIELPKGSYAPRFEQASKIDGADETSSPISEEESPRRLHPWRGYAYGLLGVLVVGVLVFLGWRYSLQEPTLPVAKGQAPADIVVTIPPGPSIAVLPFENLSGDESQDYFGVGLAEHIIVDLTRFRDLFVIASDTTVHQTKSNRDPRDIGRKLGVTYVLTGSVQKEPNELRVTATLIDVDTGRVIWSDGFNRPLEIDKILELQDDITKKIVSAISPSYGAIYHDMMKDINRHQTDSFDAFNCVLRAMALRERNVTAPVPEIIECLEDTIRTSPHYAQAWALLSIIYFNEYSLGYNPHLYSFDSEQRGYEAALRAVEEDPQSAISYSALSTAYFFRQDIELFHWYGKKAIGLNHNDVDTLASFGMKAAMAGEWEFGLRLIEKAITLNPSHPTWYFVPIALYHYARGEYRLADVETRKIRHTEYLSYHVLRAMIAGQLGNEEVAESAVTTIRTISPEFSTDVRELMRRWNFQDPFTEHVIEGLRKAGLRIPD